MANDAIMDFITGGPPGDYADRAIADAGGRKSGFLERLKYVPKEALRGALRTLIQAGRIDPANPTAKDADNLMALLGGLTAARAPGAIARGAMSSTVGSVGANVAKGRPFFHGVRGGAENTQRIMREGFLRGRSAENETPGTSLASNPLVSILKFDGHPMHSDKENALLFTRVPKDSQVYNLRPSEYMLNRLLNGNTLDSIKRSHVVSTPRSYYDESELFTPREQANKVEIRRPSDKEVVSMQRAAERDAIGGESTSGILNNLYEHATYPNEYAAAHELVNAAAVAPSNLTSELLRSREYDPAHFNKIIDSEFSAPKSSEAGKAVEDVKRAFSEFEAAHVKHGSNSFKMLGASKSPQSVDTELAGAFDKSYTTLRKSINKLVGSLQRLHSVANATNSATRRAAAGREGGHTPLRALLDRGKGSNRITDSNSPSNIRARTYSVRERG